jgi:hypothetical protein
VDRICPCTRPPWRPSGGRRFRKQTRNRLSSAFPNIHCISKISDPSDFPILYSAEMDTGPSITPRSQETSFLYHRRVVPVQRLRHLARSWAAQPPGDWAILLKGEDQEWEKLSPMKCDSGGTAGQRDPDIKDQKCVHLARRARICTDIRSIDRGICENIRLRVGHSKDVRQICQTAFNKISSERSHKKLLKTVN